MFRKLFQLFISLFGLHANQVSADANHLVDNRRSWHSPRTAGGRLLDILNKDADFTKLVNELGYEHVLLRFAMCGDKLRVNAYRASAELDYGFKIYDPDWETNGMFHYLVSRCSATLMIRDLYPDLRYNPYDPEFSWILPLTGNEVIELQGNWQAVPA